MRERYDGLVLRPLPCVLLFVLAAGLAPGCACDRELQFRDGRVDLRRDALCYVVVNDDTEKVVYDYSKILVSGQDYERYASGRRRGAVKRDVPLAIAEYLHHRGKRVLLGGEATVPPGGDVLVVRYRELWGWDLGDIIKALSIEIGPPGAGERVTVSFEEKTIFNSRPTADDLVPQMLDQLFARQGAARAGP